jgi:flagellar hook-basal body protein
MAFLRSLFAGVSALRNHQTMMDVIGNNIANVNTVGFKAGRATFSELYAQTLRGATMPTATNGGTNPMQVGLGMAVNSLDTLFTQGNIETTSNPFDLAISGQGMFVVNQNGQTMYTRAGDFGLDAEGRIVTGTGAILQGKMANAAGVIPAERAWKTSSSIKTCGHSHRPAPSWNMPETSIHHAVRATSESLRGVYGRSGTGLLTSRSPSCREPVELGGDRSGLLGNARRRRQT